MVVLCDEKNGCVLEMPLKKNPKLQALEQNTANQHRECLFS